MKRSLSLDFFKIFLSFLIVLAHLYPLFESGEMRSDIWLGGLCRVVVPSFFILNGYFLFSKIDSFTAIRKYITQLALVYLVWSVAYSAFYIGHTPLLTILGRVIFGYYHLWYLPALLMAVLLLIGLRKVVKNDMYILLIILFIYMIGHIIDPYRPMAHYTRNGFFIGLPCVTIGYFLRKYNVKEWFKIWQLSLIIVLGIGALILESVLLMKDGGKFSDMYLSSLFLAPATIMFVLKKPLLVNRTTLTDYVGDLSTGIYFVHMFFVFKLYAVSYNIYTLPGVFALSVLTTIPLIYINKRAKILL